MAMKEYLSEEKIKRAEKSNVILAESRVKDLLGWITLMPKWNRGDVSDDEGFKYHQTADESSPRGGMTDRINEKFRSDHAKSREYPAGGTAEDIDMNYGKKVRFVLRWKSQAQTIILDPFAFILLLKSEGKHLDTSVAGQEMISTPVNQ
ncbi:hypothetical protein DVH24_002382 [Malus domestica]|uniref:Uncharacterized protein n=1 Tax=Malus domestica TaxID=3750 RepID=A0A498KQ60_MALDO|nr:hypothetical protein DVH24_002382 [Malus domestica]